MRRYRTFDLIVELVASLHVAGRRTGDETVLTSLHSAQVARTKYNDLRARLSGLNLAEVTTEATKASKGAATFGVTVDTLLRLRVRGQRNTDTGVIRIESVQGNERGPQAGDGLLRRLGPGVIDEVRESVERQLASGEHPLGALRAVVRG